MNVSSVPAAIAKRTQPFLAHHDRIKILVAAATFIILRSPILLMQGRINAEEGTVYFRDAWISPFWKAFLAPHQGYYSLLDNCVALFAADLVPLKLVPVAFGVSALLVHLLLVVVVLTCEYFKTPMYRALAVAVCLLSPSLEVWMTLEDSQFVLGAIVAIILISNSERLLRFRGAALLLAGFTGPVSCFFLPFYWIRAARRRRRGAVVQAILLTIPTFTQMYVVLHSLHTGGRSFAGLAKLSWLGPILLVKVVSPTFTTRLSFFLWRNLLLHHGSTALFVVCWVLGIIGVGAILYIVSKGGRVAVLLTSLACWSLLLSYTGIGESVRDLIGGANRYFYIANLLIWLAILITYMRSRELDPGASRPYRNLVLLLLVSGFLDAAGYWKRAQRIDHPWAPQIARWQSNPNVPIAVNPVDWPEQLVLVSPRPSHDSQ